MADDKKQVNRSEGDVEQQPFNSGGNDSDYDGGQPSEGSEKPAGGSTTANVASNREGTTPNSSSNKSSNSIRDPNTGRNDSDYDGGQPYEGSGRIGPGSTESKDQQE